MTDDERFGLLMGSMTIPMPGSQAVVPKGVPPTAGYVPGVPRLGIPPQIATDASLGVTNPLQIRPGDVATAMPSGLALASSFDPVLAERVGAAIGREAKAKGFNVLLGGGVNLTRDPKNGRNFEYLGEDPLLAGRLAGHSIRGTQSQGVVSTIKHFVLNAQETQRHTANAVIDENALRESDLLAFEIGIEIGNPGAVMCAYNRVNGSEACGNGELLNRVLKQDWGFKGWVMSDWGAVEGPDFILQGLDQQAGSQLDKAPWFGAGLQALVASGQVPRERISDASRRILRSLFAVGVSANPSPSEIDYADGAAVALDAARAGSVLLKNDGLLPINSEAKRILVIGGRADFGVLSGGGSSQVTPSNGAPHFVVLGGDGIAAQFNRQMYMPSSPLGALRKLLPDRTFSFDGGYSAESAAAKAAGADLVIVFATKWETETTDSPSLSLPNGQDHLIEAVSSANPRTIVVLETGNPVTMPWLSRVNGVVQAWYPGQEGGQAIAEVLAGRINPSGRLPMTYPQSLAQLPRPDLPGLGLPDASPVDVSYSEGADVGYRLFAKQKMVPLFPFGFGLSYTKFRYSKAAFHIGSSLSAAFSVQNIGNLDGADVPQLYLVRRNGEAMRRLVGFQRLDLTKGDRADATMQIDPRLLADFRSGQWLVPAGQYTFALGRNAFDLDPGVTVTLTERRIKP
ncbi:MAG: beta-glucosidase [Sphingorhabdus sp.]